MSLNAMTWVMEHAPTVSPGEILVLYGLADQATKEGKAAYPSQTTLAYLARCTPRTVQNHLTSLKKKGIIKEGDQSKSLNLPGNNRPVVYDLNMDLRREQSLDQFREEVRREKAAEKETTRARKEAKQLKANGFATPANSQVNPEGGNIFPPSQNDDIQPEGGKSEYSRGENPGTLGGKPVSPDPSTNPKDNPKDKEPPIVPQGDECDDQVVDAEIVEDSGTQLAILEGQDTSPAVAPPAKPKPKKRATGQLPTDYTPEFLQFWDMWPAVKTEKPAVFKRWNIALEAGTSPAEILAGVQRYSAYYQVKGTDMRYRKGFRKWFDGRCWEDELTIDPRTDRINGNVLNQMHEQAQLREQERLDQLAGYTSGTSLAERQAIEEAQRQAIEEDIYGEDLYQ